MEKTVIEGRDRYQMHLKPSSLSSCSTSSDPSHSMHSSHPKAKKRASSKTTSSQPIHDWGNVPNHTHNPSHYSNESLD